MRAAADAYMQLGVLAEKLGRFAEAEASKQRAYKINADPRTRVLARMLARSGKHQEAVRLLVDGAVARYQETRQWDPEYLAWLHREHALVDPGEFAALVKAAVSADLIDDLSAAIEQASGTAKDESGADGSSGT